MHSERDSKRINYAATGALVLALSVVSFGAYAKKSNPKIKGDAGLTDLKYRANDETGNEMRALKAEVFIAAQEDKAIEQVNKLLKKYKGTALEADLLLRLGELYMRRSKTDRFLEVHRNSEVLVTFAPKIVKNAGSRQQILKAVKIYDEIERRFPRYEKLDIVVFNNAFSNQQINEFKKAEIKYSRLVREFPHSNLLPDGHLALGEISFNRRDFKKALAHFQAIRQYPDSLVYPYGLYKAGWTQYNLRNAEAGLKELEDVIRYGKFVREQGIDARLDLRREALIDMTLFYSDFRLAKDAYAYFEKQSSELDISPVILRLAELYKRHSRHQDIKVILSEFIKRKPTSGHIPMAYVELMDASDKLKKPKDVVTLLENFNGLCSVKSAWARSQTAESLVSKDSPLSGFIEDDDKNVTPAFLCNRVFSKMALGYANKWLKQWQRDNKQIELADATEKSFSLYLASEGETADSARARFVYSELLFKREKFRLASANYEIAGRLAKEKAMAHDSRYFAIFSLEKAVKDKWSDKDEALFRRLANEYITKNVDGKYVMDVEFKMAFIAYEKARYDEAAPLFLKLGTRFANHDRGLKAQDLYLDILNIKKDFATLRDYSVSLRNQTKDEARKEKLNKIYEEAYFLIVQSYEQKGDWKTAVGQYQSFAENNPKSSLAQKALWNAIQLQYKGGDLTGGAMAAIAYSNRFPKTKESVDALMKAAQTYESMGQLRQAANVLETLASMDNEQREKWLILAADFYVLSSDITKAKPLYESLRSSREGNTGFRSLEQLELISRSGSNIKLRETLLKDLQNTGRQPQASLASLYFVEQAYEAKKYDEAFALAKKVIAQEKSGAARAALAGARFVQAKILANEFKSQSVKSQLERVQVVLTLKTEKLSKAQIAFQSAANYGDPKITVAAYRELADCYLHYSEAIMGMPVPKGLPVEEADAFKSEMQKLAIPMEEKGIDTKLMAYQSAKELGAADQVVMDLQNELKKLNQQVVRDTSQVRIQPALMVLPRLEGVGS